MMSAYVSQSEQANVSLKQKEEVWNEVLRDLRSLKKNHDVRIICDENKVLFTSSFLLILSSDYLKCLLSNVDEEGYVIILSNYKKIVVQLLIDLICTGTAEASCAEEFAELELLVQVLQINSLKEEMKLEEMKEEELEEALLDSNYEQDEESEDEEDSGGDEYLEGQDQLSKPLQYDKCLSILYTPEEILLREGLEGKIKRKKLKRKAPSDDDGKVKKRKLCDKCDKSIGRKEFPYHKKYHSYIVEDIDSYVCQICSKTFKTGSRFETHLKSNCRDVIPCEYCGKTFKVKDCLKTHIQNQHIETEKKFECEICHKRFKTKGNLNIHGISHSSKRSFVCDKCGYAAKSKSTLKNHLSIHYEDMKKFPCPQCDKTFLCPIFVQKHIDSAHSDHRGFTCEECGSAFKLEENLKKHKIATHGPPTFKCNICSAVFKAHEGIKKHIILHTDTQPFECLLCDAKYKHREAIRRHLNSQHPEHTRNPPKSLFKFKTNEKIQELLSTAIIKI